MLEIHDLDVDYGESRALTGIDIRVPKGSLVSVIGPNGAGKSTLLKTISGLVRPARGRIVFDGGDLTGESPDRIVERGVIHVPEGRMVLGRMTVRENLLLGAYSRPRRADLEPELERIFELFPRLRERLGQLAGSLSGGEQQMLAIGRGLMGRPKLLMLDEPSLGLAPIIVSTIFEVLAAIREAGVTVLLVEQNAERALAASDFGYVLDLGLIVAHGAAGDLAGDERVRKAYLGL